MTKTNVTVTDPRGATIDVCKSVDDAMDSLRHYLRSRNITIVKREKRDGEIEVVTDGGVYWVKTK